MNATGRVRVCAAIINKLSHNGTSETAGTVGVRVAGSCYRHCDRQIARATWAGGREWPRCHDCRLGCGFFCARRGPPGPRRPMALHSTDVLTIMFDTGNFHHGGGALNFARYLILLSLAHHMTVLRLARRRHRQQYASYMRASGPETPPTSQRRPLALPRNDFRLHAPPEPPQPPTPPSLPTRHGPQAGSLRARRLHIGTVDGGKPLPKALALPKAPALPKVHSCCRLLPLPAADRRRSGCGTTQTRPSRRRFPLCSAARRRGGVGWPRRRCCRRCCRYCCTEERPTR